MSAAVKTVPCPNCGAAIGEHCRPQPEEESFWLSYTMHMERARDSVDVERAKRALLGEPPTGES